MTGGLAQIVAYGAQDIYLTGNPLITYFKVVYRRHTNFAIESIEQTYTGTGSFGHKIVCTIARNGDLIHGIYLQAVLPDIIEKGLSDYEANTEPTEGTGPHKRYTRWVDNVGHFLIKQVDIEIGSQLIDRQYGDWLEIWSQLTVPAGQRLGYLEMIGQDVKNNIGQNTGLQADVYSNPTATAANNALLPEYPAVEGTLYGRTIYVPLQFWFCRNIGLALPLIALQYHEVRINMEFRHAYELVMTYTGDVSDPGAWGTTNNSHDTYVSHDALSVGIWVDYIYLDTEERHKYAQVSHEYLIEQVQFTGDETAEPSYTEGTKRSKTIQLNLNHPVKELIWVAKAFESNKEWCNYTDTGLDSVPPFQAIGSSGAGTTGSTEYGLTGLPVSNMIVSEAGGIGTLHGLDRIDTLAKLSKLTDYSQTRPISNGRYAQNPVMTAKIVLNGHDRMATKEGAYFNWMQCRNHHTNIPESPGINVYSFALKPEDHQPSGTCNFSRIDYCSLLLTIGTFRRDGSILTAEDLPNVTIRVYAVNYNILRIMSGMAGLAYN